MTAGNTMTFLWILSIAWILEIGDVVTQALTEAPAHTMKKCIQDKFRDIKCEEFNEDQTEMVSLWPPGPYAIPMTRFGCPESSMQGWREGYIQLAWGEPQKVRINSNSSSIDIVDEDMFGNFKAEQMFTDFEKYQMFLPTTPNSVTLYFCYKHRSNTSVDTGLWPDENYRIFGTEKSCPIGFEGRLSNIKLPQISWWDSDGYLPYFEILNNNNSEAMLQLRLCSRSKSQNLSNVSGSRYRNWTHFFLIKSENTSCPTLINTSITEERLYIGSISMMQVMATLCFYELTTDEDNWLYETRRKNAYSVLIASTTEGNKTLSTESTSFVWGFFFQKTIVKTVWQWKIFDLGRTIAVSSVDITMRYRRILQNTCIIHDVNCFISRGKWNFLHSKALSCLHVPYCLVKGFSISLVFKRIKEGRYLTLMYKEESNIGYVFSEQVVIFKVNVFTETIKYDMSDSCNSDLGMLNLNIGDDQISASSWQQEFTPLQSRPYLSGWCPQYGDRTPYLQVSFSMKRIIEGLSVYIARDVLLTNGVKTVVSFGGQRITLFYGDNDNDTVSSKILRIDSSQLDAGTQSFWFLKPIQTKIVKMYIEKEQTVDLACLRFELHGCGLDERLLPDSFFKRERQFPPFEIVGYISEIDTFNCILTSIGFPENYQSGQLYKWIIHYSESHFVKLVFTHLDLNTVKNGDEVECSDVIILSEDLEISPAKTTKIDNSISLKHSLSIETKETLIVLSFVTCSLLSPINRGSGFKAIATYQDIPACFSLHSIRDLEDMSSVNCRHPSMFITSKTYRGFKFIDANEKWIIYVPTRRISLRVIDFNVPCRSSIVTSTFTIKDMENEKSYCNINMPPDIINSSSDKLHVLFSRYYDFSSIAVISNQIGFRMFYTVIEEPEQKFIDYMDNYSEAFNVAIYKYAHQSKLSVSDRVNRVPEKLIDGNTFPDFDSGSCTGNSAGWWLLDLKSLYDLEYIVVYGAIESSDEATVDVNKDICAVTISTGLHIHDLQRTGIICAPIGHERVINQTGIKTRYVRLNLVCNKKNYILGLCEMKVYGKLAGSTMNEYVLDLFEVETIDGEWGDWTAWTDVCFCDEKQYRYRLCNEPTPQFGALHCPGDSISHRRCHFVPTPCEDFHYIGFSDEVEESCTGNTAGSDSLSKWGRWSEWSSCSSDCGNGLMSRKRLCISSSNNQEIKRKCVGQHIERKTCIGNRKCLICSDTFSKCYSIIAKYTNWQQAQIECFSWNMTLVTMLSLSEMHFVKYLLRQKRRNDGLPINYFNAGFYVHIGLRVIKDWQYEVPVWDSGQYALYFTAWKTNQSSSGLCVRMNFELFNDDNTWEFEDCEKQLSEYTMCEYQRKSGPVPNVKTLKIWKDEEKVEIPEEIPISEYEGDVNVTVSGKYCSGTYCRPLSYVDYIKCLNTDGDYEECSVKLPAVKNSSFTFHKYLGKLDKTFSGKTCQRWDRTVPHMHDVHGNMFKGEGISDAANYCRDIGDTDFLWCFTNKPDTRWEPCLLGDLKSERKCVTQLQYTGTRNTSITGKACMPWDKSIRIFGESLSPEINLTDAENFCRDPLNFGFLWCFIDSPYSSEEWEPCQHQDYQPTKLVSNRSFVSSSFDMFTCGNGIQIPDHLRCNGRFDCEDRSDETECLDVYTVHDMLRVDNRSVNPFGFEKGSFLRCTSGEWISVIARCNVVIDCLDASDETNCNYNSSGYQECGLEQFRCDDGDCIHISQVCNFVDDCIDGSDEYCDPEDFLPFSEYRCKNGQHIPSVQRCDAIKQCPDGSDEIECETCQSNAFHCDFALCIPKRLMCDNSLHCQDGTDETFCDMGDFNSCQDIWKAGYRQTGQYIIGSVPVYCVFDNVLEENSVTTILYFDIAFTEVKSFVNYIRGLFYNEPLSRTESGGDFFIFKQVNSNCTQQVVETCSPTYEILDHLVNGSDCYCGILNFEMKRPYRESISVCQSTSYNNLSLSLDKPRLENTNIFYKQIDNRRLIHLGIYPEPYVEIKPGPAICRHDFIPSDDDVLCNVNGKHIPSIQRCIYDIDASGFPTGCTDGSHLINCEFYNCPPNTLKCPGSFCIPQRFLCDGIQQCPGGEDEEDCGCTISNNEILVMYDAASTEGPDFSRFARQFYTQTNIVRLLGFKASKPLEVFNIKEVLLEINDIEISRSPTLEQTFSCNYKILTRDFLNSVHFTNTGIKGVIVLQNSDISKDVFIEIAKGGTYTYEDVKLYRVSQFLDTVTSTDNMIMSNFTDVRVRRWSNLDDIGAEYFSEICKISTKVHCLSGYKCSSSKTCIPMEQVCDGHKQCLHGDDEVLCDFKCPAHCKCDGYFANCRDTNFEPSMLNTVPKNTRYVDFSLNRKLNSVLQNTLLNFTKLATLNVSDCGIKVLSQYAFLRLRNLRNLDLSYNNITVLPNYAFASLAHLQSLILRGNKELAVIERHAFSGLSQIQDLNLANARIYKILAGTFEGLKLKNIDLSNNKIENIEQYAFQNSFIENINFERNDIKHFHKDIFTGLVGLEILKTPAFKFCCIRPSYVSEQDCYPQKDAFSSCDDLMRHSGLQFMIWLIGIMALIGNALSVFYRIRYDRERLKLGYGIFVTNLAVADFLMAVYLLIIAIADSAFRKRYIYVDDYWRHSIWCNIAGVLSTTSSEASVLFLCLITLDRLLVIKFPFGGVKITTNIAIASVVCAWLFSAFVALMPVAYVKYFQNEFYSKSGVCIALPLTMDRPPGWAYSLALFVCLNFVTFILIAVGQLSIFLEIRKSPTIATSAARSRKRDLKVARNLLLVVATDFLCWFPIGVMGMLALSGHPVSGEVYAWAAVFILPVNSALNPLLYTLSAIIGVKSFNPSSDEQSLLKITKDIGENATKCIMAANIIFPKKTASKFQNISTVSSTKLDISLETVIIIAAKLALCLDALHCSSLVMQPLDEKYVFVGVHGNEIIGFIKIKRHPCISHKPEDREKDMYQYGIILKSLIAAKKNKNI